MTALIVIIHLKRNASKLYNMNDTSSKSADKPNPQNKIPPGNRFKWWWIYVFMLIFLLPFSLQNIFSTSKEITWQQFEKDILSRKAVEKIVVVNNEKAEIYIKKEFADDSMFRAVLKKGIGKSINPGPHYSFNIGSVESFERKLDVAEKDFAPNEKIPLSVVSRTNWFLNIIGWILPFILIFAVCNYLLRRSG